MKHPFSRRIFFSMLLAVGIIATAQACFATDPNSTAMAPGLSSDLRETTSLVTSIFKVMGSLAIVVGLMLLLVYFLKKSGLSKGLSHNGTLINVLESRMVAPKKYIAIVEIANKCVAVGITDTNITMLTDVDNSLAESNKPSENRKKDSPSFSGLLQKASFSIGKKSSQINTEPSSTKEKSNVN